MIKVNIVNLVNKEKWNGSFVLECLYNSYFWYFINIGKLILLIKIKNMIRIKKK